MGRQRPRGVTGVGPLLLARVISAPDFMPEITPVEEHGGVLVKREDAWSLGGASGAKVRAIIEAATGHAGIITAGSRISPQLERAALAARALGIPARLHTGSGGDTYETACAAAAGATILRHNPARLTVIKARFRTDAEALPGWAAIGYGMDHPAYLRQVAEQAASLPEFGRLVLPVGSGMTLAGILRGISRSVPILGVRVGGDPAPCLDRHAPGWRDRVQLTPSPYAYTDRAPNVLGALTLDPHYEAKCLPFLRSGDLLWTVGIRASALPARERGGQMTAPRCRAMTQATAGSHAEHAAK